MCPIHSNEDLCLDMNYSGGKQGKWTEIYESCCWWSSEYSDVDRINYESVYSSEHFVQWQARECWQRQKYYWNSEGPFLMDRKKNSWFILDTWTLGSYHLITRFGKLAHHFSQQTRTAWKDLYRKFTTRHPDLCLKYAEATCLYRAVGFSEPWIDLLVTDWANSLKSIHFLHREFLTWTKRVSSCIHENIAKTLSVTEKKQVGNWPQKKWREMSASLYAYILPVINVFILSLCYQERESATRLKKTLLREVYLQVNRMVDHQRRIPKVVERSR
jgi:hypothetical protein